MQLESLFNEKDTASYSMFKHVHTNLGPASFHLA